VTTNTVARAALGDQPDALAGSVSLATPLTMSRLTGREHVVGVLRQLAGAFSVSEPEFVTQDDDRAAVTFAGHAEGHDVGLLAVLTSGSDGRYQAIDLYARPWPFVAMVRDRLAAGDDLYRDVTCPCPTCRPCPASATCRPSPRRPRSPPT
jgi:hypothetical protein